MLRSAARLAKGTLLAFEGLPKDWIPVGVEYTKINRQWGARQEGIEEMAMACKVRALTNLIVETLGIGFIPILPNLIAAMATGQRCTCLQQPS